jgi:hypothetical protein
MLENLARDKQSISLETFLNYERKKFYDVGPWTMVTGFPDVRLTPYIGAVVLNDDLQSRAGVSPPPEQAAGFSPV